VSRDENGGLGITGTPHPGTFECACYCVHNHSDVTGTVVLDWYETSDGHDYFNSEEFMRATIEAAREVVRILNQQLPGRVNARTEMDWSGTDDT
jgi:hypothetical protein